MAVHTRPGQRHRGKAAIHHEHQEPRGQPAARLLHQLPYLRGFLGLRDDVAPGYEAVDYEVRIKGDGSPQDFEDIHQTVMKTSPNYFNMSRPIKMNGTLSVG